MGQGAVQNVGDDLHVGVGVSGEATARCNTVVVDDPQGAKSHVFRVVVIAEREGVATIEPAEVCPAAFARTSHNELH